MYVVLLFAAAALLSDSRAASVNRHMKMIMDNSIDSNLMSPRHQTKRFITITKRPLARSGPSSGAIELTCEAIAAPAPSVHWFKDDVPIYEYDKESNEIIDTNPSSLGRVTSTLLVPRPAPRARYTCLIVSGANTKRASTVVYGSVGAETSERARLVPLSPRILVSYKVFVDLIGASVALPCRARGHPRPRVEWTDNNGNPIAGPRMKVLRSGELVIAGLRWEDMGEFVCRATNTFGTTHSKTFVYPARPDDQDG